ncbi:MAG: elongation factor Ts [Candidatus Paracaedimonas acanthamoebae]|uniref:Elongation factor Ts n=1 Tax=Candidatus Paracaedimonas acanthamoebae TaxID=244581 RepID=A0A8J7TUQ6_9PROT|nr:elongation factor Ts [Candidatus Paracaedimonas acanthamoebae]
MTEISASAVKELRERTGAGMMDCKKALTENKGDMEAAVDWLRTKGLAAAAKKAGRTAAEGLVGAVTTGTVGAIIEINAETDFVARNEKFQEYVKTAANLALKANSDLDAFKNTSYPDTGRSIAEELTNLISVIGENMEVRRFKNLQVEQGVVTSYIHSAIAPGLGRIGVLVALESSGEKAKLETLGKQIAMHAAAANPQACNIADLDPSVIERERKIFAEQARESGKKEEFIEKMIEGRLRKFYEESVLVEQVYLIDDTKRKVSQVIADAAKEIGVPVDLKGFALFKLGEGIEKEVADFAAEVAQQLGK